MQSLAALVDRLILAPTRDAKLALIAEHVRAAPDPHRGWALAALAGDLSLPSIRPAAIRDLAATRLDDELYALSRDYVGDVMETIALMWPARPGANRPPDITEIVETLQPATKPEVLIHVERWLGALDPPARWVLLKLVTGGLRIGVTPPLVRQALARFGGVEVSRIDEIWHGITPPYSDIFAWLEGRAPRPAPDLRAPFRPFMQAQAIAPGEEPAAITPDTHAAEWLWDGERAQLSSEHGVTRLFNRAGDDMSAGFPELSELHFDGALDGVLLVRTPHGGLAPLTDLQARLARKSPTSKHVAAHPTFLRAFDLLQDGPDDLRTLPFAERRRHLERFVVTLDSPAIDLSPLLPFTSVRDLNDLRNAPPAPGIAGVILKRRAAPHLAGRESDAWLKWKHDPHRIRAVLMYAQRAPGRRSGPFTEFGIGVWTQVDGVDQLAPIGKVVLPPGTNEATRVDAYVHEAALDRFGPVTTVAATPESGLVLDIAVDGVLRSARRKSGLVVRSPRLISVLWDAPALEASRMEDLNVLLTA